MAWLAVSEVAVVIWVLDVALAVLLEAVAVGSRSNGRRGMVLGNTFDERCGFWAGEM